MANFTTTLSIVSRTPSKHFSFVDAMNKLVGYAESFDLQISDISVDGSSMKIVGDMVFTGYFSSFAISNSQSVLSKIIPCFSA